MSLTAELILKHATKFLAISKLKAFADNYFIVVQFLFDKVVNIVIKSDNADCQHFLIFRQYLQKAFLSLDFVVKG